MVDLISLVMVEIVSLYYPSLTFQPGQVRAISLGGFRPAFGRGKIPHKGRKVLDYLTEASRLDYLSAVYAGL